MRIKTSSIAIIGAGHWGKNLIRIYDELGALKIICDKNQEALDRLAERYPHIQYSTFLHDVYGHKDIDGIVIATPAETHFAIARETLLTGKHVYVEKPFVLKIKEAVELIALAKSEKRILMVGHFLQYHPGFIRLKELVKQGELGRINYIYSNRLNLGKIRREENILWSFAPHDVSMILALAAEFPHSLSAIGGSYLHKKIADVTNTHLNFSSGLQAHIFVSWLHPYKEQKLVVVGAHKMAVLDDTLPWSNKLQLYPHKTNWNNNIPTFTKLQPELMELRESEPLRQECEEFLDCISTERTPITDGNEGLQVVQILNACQYSLDNNGMPVNIATCAGSLVKHDAPEIHPTAEIDSGVKISSGTKVWHFSHILFGSIIGTNCNIGQNVVIGPQVTIGDNCKIQNNVSIFKGITLEDAVFCGPSVVFTNVHNPRSHIPRMEKLRPTVICKGATLGANSTFVCGNNIGKYAMVGAGAVVTKTVPDHALVYGNPARQAGWVCECGEKLNSNLCCFGCHKKYECSPGGGLRQQ